MVFIYFVVDAYRIDLSKLEDPVGTPTVIYDRYGDPVSELSSVRFRHVSLSKIPEEIIHSIIAVEDQRFFSHKGIDFRGIARSTWRNLQAGRVVQGGSTITQQLAKNLFLTSDRTYGRKFREVITAFRIEREYSKEKILELYLNHIYFGEGIWGIQNASQMYFGKDVQDITLEEGALLAALPKAPTHYSPFQNEERGKQRRDLVLYLLLEQGYIEENVYTEAISSEIVLRDWEIEEDSLRGRYPSYVDFVIDEAIKIHGLTEERIWAGDLHIYTEMDLTVQNAIQSAFSNGELFPVGAGEEIVQGGTVVLDPYTGGVRGIMGNRSEHVYRGFNRAVQLKRQPGSAIKPLSVFAPALERGYSASSTLVDERMDFGGYSPRNYDNQYRGRVSLYDALIYSINVPAVWLLNEIGVTAGVDFLEKLGIPLQESDRNLSIALGGLTEGTSPLQLAQAYSVFPNLGTMNEAHAITKITNGHGEVLAKGEVQGTQVMDPDNAYRMTQILQGVVQEGTGRNALLNYDRPTAGKTGTTQLPSTSAFEGVTGVSDAWFVGYTPELVTAVWVGYDKVTPEYVMQSSGGNHPARIFQAIMSESLEGVPVSDFRLPNGWKENKNEGKGKEKDKEGKDKGKGKGNKEGKEKGKNKAEEKGKKNEGKGKGNGKGKGKGNSKGNR
ncbi:penicillin-binding protein 2A [Evansella vedderi]|uniref:Penicillin-binding protein 2A n=2 Tax=Evansella vedderi TaxID=38282 RepID=A0ABT9ZVN9_9BACI|nr:penicillin-binding protein 2A [Evansella vedderi]